MLEAADEFVICSYDTHFATVRSQWFARINGHAPGGGVADGSKRAITGVVACERAVIGGSPLGSGCDIQRNRGTTGDR